MARPQELFSIGDVAQLFHLSVSSLRHYETIGLLTPEYTDPATGYRYYGPRQFEVLNTIRYLRALDMPLGQIRAFLRNRDVGRIEQLLREQKAAVVRKQAELQRVERKIDNRLRQLHAVADVAVVSAANESAIASEWKRYGLARHADVIFGQEVGSKANSIATMLACGYESRKVMMVGDAMGDAQAAAANGVAFVPILPGREADSWRRLQEEALPKLLHGTFSPAYQAELLAALRSALHG